MSDPGVVWAAVAEGFKTLQALGRGISEPLQEIVGMGTDHLKVVRFERQFRLADRVRAVMRDHGIERLDRRIPLNTLLPLLEKASLEEDDELQDVWARMMVNAGDSQNPDEVRRAFVSMLAEMTGFDVKNLSLIVAANPSPLQCVWTGDLPRSASLSGLRENPAHTGEPSQDVAVSLGNLVRLGCLTFAPGWDGVMLARIVGLTDLGRAFVRACTLHPL